MCPRFGMSRAERAGPITSVLEPTPGRVVVRSARDRSERARWARTRPKPRGETATARIMLKASRSRASCVTGPRNGIWESLVVIGPLVSTGGRTNAHPAV